ncbi:hypothetical protein EYF80_024930 [Liparis tanakae]|uniref:Uncharacterized protein n=1 Tax=Liparis tanakae TaxID=230148 RepID=A0A4Z2HG44_9TELE|nr:hypothetical protein EYF80_024930 [Liparis tanakae]
MANEEVGEIIFSGSDVDSKCSACQTVRPLQESLYLPFQQSAQDPQVRRQENPTKPFRCPGSSHDDSVPSQICDEPTPAPTHALNIRLTLAEKPFAVMRIDGAREDEDADQCVGGSTQHPANSFQQCRNVQVSPEAERLRKDAAFPKQSQLGSRSDSQVTAGRYVELDLIRGNEMQSALPGLAEAEDSPVDSGAPSQAASLGNYRACWAFNEVHNDLCCLIQSVSPRLVSRTELSCCKLLSCMKKQADSLAGPGALLSQCSVLLAVALKWMMVSPLSRRGGQLVTSGGIDV